MQVAGVGPRDKLKMMMTPIDEALITETRRQFFSRTARGLGVTALATMFGRDGRLSAMGPAPDKYIGGLPSLPHFAPKAKRAVYMHMVGGPPQLDLFDYKPGLKDWYDKDLPDSVRQGQRLTTMTSGQTRFPIAPSIYKFAQHGRAARGCRSCFRIPRRWWTTSPS